jgi:hypothetical protein
MMLAKLYDNSGNGLGLKNWLELGEADTQYDALLTGLLMAVSGRFETGCRRSLGRGENIVEILDGGRNSISLSRYPIESISEVVESRYQDWTNGYVLTENQNFVADKKSGLLYRENFRWGVGPQSVRVTYTGGYVLPGETATTGQMELPAEIQFAILEQCRFEWKRRGDLGITSAGAGGGSWQVANNEEWLSSVKAVVRRYYRY